MVSAIKPYQLSEEMLGHIIKKRTTQQKFSSVNMTEMSDVSLHCIRYNKNLVLNCEGKLSLEESSNPIKKNALWTLKYSPFSWTLINQFSSKRLTFDIQKERIITSDNGATFNVPFTITDGGRDLRLSLSATIKNNAFALDLLITSDPQYIYSVPVFVSKKCDQIFRYIDYSFFNRNLTAKTTTNLHDCYDYVVIGSSFCSLAFIHRILQNDPKAKVLVLEQGLKYLAEHHQHSSPCCSPTEVEFTSWSISQKTTENEFITNVHGQIPLFGGRSTYWSGWSPTPTDKELAAWPEDLKGLLQEKYFSLAKEFLGVITADNIKAQENNKVLYGAFQNWLKNKLDSATNIESIEQVLHAPLAVHNNRCIKFSTPEMLLRKENVTINYNTTVEKILHDGKKAIALQTNQGIILLCNSKLILAMSTLPSTTLVLNSFETREFPQLSNVGKRFTAHFVSSVIARIPRRDLLKLDDASDVELGAVYISGIHAGAQYHLQLSAVTYKQCETENKIHDICKKYSANSIPQECIDKSQDYIVTSCSTLGELDYKNKSNRFNLNNNCQPFIANGELEFHLNVQDKQLWSWMDNVTFEVMKKLSVSANSDDLEYWHEVSNTWQKDVPPLEQIRKKLLVHDASTMWIGRNRDIEAPVGPDYRLKGVDNVYITGDALWPTGGSWNPVLTIVAMAMHLADTIYESVSDRMV